MYLTGGIFHQDVKVTLSTSIESLGTTDYKFTTEKKLMKIARYNHGSCVLENRLYLFGGESYSATLDSIEMIELPAEE